MFDFLGICTRNACSSHIPTVLGAALNAPELFTAMISTLATDNDVGIGIVMGSFNFNIFIVTGVVALVARRKLRSRQLKIEWLFLQRDVYFYAIGNDTVCFTSPSL